MGEYTPAPPKCEIFTFTGKAVNPLDLNIEDINVRDIAHHLACQNRFCGALRKPVSIAQHAWYVRRVVESLGAPVGVQYAALHHDDSEAYLGDVTKWLKNSPVMEGYRQAEANADEVIRLALNIQQEWADDPRIAYADKLMVRYEAEREGTPLTAQSYDPTNKSEQELIGRWWAWQADTAEFCFLEAHRQLVESNLSLRLPRK